MSNAFAPIVRARPNPIFGRPVQQGSPPIDYSPILLLKPFGFRIAPDTLSSDENLVGQRGITPAFGYSAPHPSAGGTLTLLIWALPSAHYEPLRHPSAPSLSLTGVRLSRKCGLEGHARALVDRGCGAAIDNLRHAWPVGAQRFGRGLRLHGARSCRDGSGRVHDASGHPRSHRDSPGCRRSVPGAIAIRGSPRPSRRQWTRSF